MKLRFLQILILALLTTGISGCAGILIGSAATGAAVAHDRRTAGTMLEDQSIELKARGQMGKDEELKGGVHINVTSYNSIVLLSGETPTQHLKQQAGKLVSNIEKVRKVHNHISLAQPSKLTSRSGDTLITGKVKMRILTMKREDGIESSHVKVVTENDVVYLMGLVSRREGNAAGETARKVSGVSRVVKLFEYID